MQRADRHEPILICPSSVCPLGHRERTGYATNMGAVEGGRVLGEALERADPPLSYSAELRYSPLTVKVILAYSNVAKGSINTSRTG